MLTISAEVFWAAWTLPVPTRAMCTPKAASANGFGIEAPSLNGGTGIGEIGLLLTPSPSLPISLDLGLQGYTGKREGVTGSVQLRFAF